MLTAQQCRAIIDGTWLNSTPQEEVAIEHLVIDSRQLVFPKTSAFFAIVGERVDGHQFIPIAYQMGVRNFVVTKALDIADYPAANFIQVASITTALQQLARHHRAQFELLSIGTTGSNGKTIVKEWLAHLLEADYRVVKTPRSYNSQIGVPLSIWQINKTHQVGIFEAGISQRDEMAQLAPIVNCQLGIFTNIGPAHDEGFGTRLEKIREKLQLFHESELVCYCKDQPAVRGAIQAAGLRTFSWSRRQAADLQILQETVSADGTHTQLSAQYKDQELELKLPFTDPASLENAIHCWAMMLHLGLTQKRIQERMLQLRAVEMRLEVKEGINNCILINDSYNADLNALHLALHFQAERAGSFKRTLFLSDILQSGLPRTTLYQQIGQLLEELGIQKLIAVGEAITELKGFLPLSIEAYFFPNTAAVLNYWEQLSFRDEVILLKGARPFEFERLAARLSQKEHLTTLEIDLNALLHNYLTYRSLLQASTKMMVMVKAAAYGSGSIEIARYLEANGVDYLAVAYTDEGVELRKAGVQTPIVVLNPEEASFDPLIRYRLEPELYSVQSLQRFARFLGTTTTPYPVHLKLDTGMHRLGFSPAEIPTLIQQLLAFPQLRVASVFSHLAASESKKHRAFTLRQIERYQQAYQQLTQAIGYYPIRHILNSSGIVRYPLHQMDMVRLGIGLYGIDASKSVQEKLRPVLQLKAHISQIKTVAQGETVGYDRKGIATQAMRIAVLSIGYADGLLRAAGNGQFSVLLRGQEAPTVGNICMDMCMVDISAIPAAQVGDEVIIFGRAWPVRHLAKALGTIPYEVFTNISPRVQRVYLRE
ncbi:MAG: bifunctional UDP-N-acetylmuramoyl-tripeptide:D-alanyl-D-alanine ligase/alanine racemase [Bacteroidota bacterium]